MLGYLATLTGALLAHGCSVLDMEQEEDGYRLLLGFKTQRFWIWIAAEPPPGSEERLAVMCEGVLFAKYEEWIALCN